MDAFLTNVKNKFRKADITLQFIYINVAVFIVTRIIEVIFRLFNSTSIGFLGTLEMPASLNRFIEQPWSIITYMFMHANILHIFFNMLCLYWFGKLFLNYFSSKHLRGLYLLGGIAGALFFMLNYNIFPLFQTKIESSLLIGASASILAIITAIAYQEPNVIIRFFLLGNIRLKYVAIGTIIIDLLLMSSSNSGGHFAHLGGALIGVIFVVCLNSGIDLTKWINFILDNIGKLFQKKSYQRKPKMKMKYNGSRQKDYDFNAQRKKRNNEIDHILDKLKKSGYNSLTSEEKKKLFDASNK